MKKLERVLICFFGSIFLLLGVICLLTQTQMKYTSEMECFISWVLNCFFCGLGFILLVTGVTHGHHP